MDIPLDMVNAVTGFLMSADLYDVREYRAYKTREKSHW